MVRIGVLIVFEKVPRGTDYDQILLYKATTLTGTYSLLDTVTDTSDLTYFDPAGSSTDYYKYRYNDESESSTSEYIGPFLGSATTYTDVAKVESLMQLPTRTDSTNPSIQDIHRLIQRKEDRIDKLTGHAWRQRYSGTTSGQATSADYESYDIAYAWEWHAGIPIYLKHRKIKDLDADSGDALGIWDGQDYEDWLGNRTEERDEDFWLDYSRGILYLRHQWNLKKAQGLRIKYRYGETYVDLDIEDACTKMVAIDVLSGMDPRANIIQEGNQSMRHDSRIELWTKEVKDLLHSNKEFKTVSIAQ